MITSTCFVQKDNQNKDEQHFCDSQSANESARSKKANTCYSITTHVVYKLIRLQVIKLA